MTDFTWLAIFGGAGVAAGFILQRSRLCFVSALRDLFLFQATGMTRSILLLLLLSSLGGALVIAARRAVDEPVPVLWGPPSLAAILLGGLLFGFGMVLAGSCAATAFWRTGEGQLSQVPVLLGLLLGTHAYVAVPLFPQIDMQVMANRWVQAVVLATLIAAILWRERRAKTVGEEVAVTSRLGRWRRPWHSDVGALALALLFLLFVSATGSTWRVTVAFLLTDMAAVALVGGLVLGGHLSARWGREWRIRPIGTWPEVRLRLAGGLFMGYGARMASGCTVGLLLSGAVLSTWNILWWIAAVVVGAWVGSVALRQFIARLLRS
ncbi:MAG: YeeE/YedE thiosulfate transporter family protein [Bacillota bacterium]